MIYFYSSFYDFLVCIHLLLFNLDRAERLNGHWKAIEGEQVLSWWANIALGQFWTLFGKCYCIKEAISQGSHGRSAAHIIQLLEKQH